MATINGVTFNMQNLRPVVVHRNKIAEQPGSDTNFITDMGYDGLVLRLEGFEETLATYDSVISEFMKSGEQTLVHRTGWQFKVYSAQLTPELIAGFADNYFPYDLILYTSTPYRERTTETTRSKTITANNQEWSASDIPCSNLLENWSFEEYAAGFTGWSFVGTGSVSQSVTHKVGTYAAELLCTGGTYAYLQQTIPHVQYRDKQLTFGKWVKCATVGKVKLRIYDGTNAYSSANSTTDWEFLTVTKTIDGAAAILLCGSQLNIGYTAYLDGAVLIEADSIPDYLVDIDTDGSVDAVPDIRILSDHLYPTSENQEYDATERNTASTSYVLMSTTTHTGISEKRSQITEVKAQFGMSGAGSMGYKWTAQATSYLDNVETTIVEDTYPDAGYAYRTHDVSGDDIIAGIGESFTIKLYIKMIAGGVSAYEKTNYTTEDITAIYLKDVEIYNVADSTVKLYICNNIINGTTVRINVDGTGTYNLLGDLTSSNFLYYDCTKSHGATYDAVDDELDIADDGYIYWLIDSKSAVTGIPTLTAQINITTGTPTVQISTDAATWYDITTAIVDDVDTEYELDSSSLHLKGQTSFYWRIDCVKAGAATCSVKSFELDINIVTIDFEHPRITTGGAASTFRCDQDSNSGMNCTVSLIYRDRSWPA